MAIDGVPMPVLVISNNVLLPGARVRITITQSSTMRLIRKSLGEPSSNLRLAVVSLCEGVDKLSGRLTWEGDGTGNKPQVYGFGTVAEVRRVTRWTRGGRSRFALELIGRQRLRLLALDSTEPFVICRVQLLEDVISDEAEASKLLAAVVLLLGRSAPVMTPSEVADWAAARASLSFAQQQKLLELRDVKERLALIANALAARAPDSKLSVAKDLDLLLADDDSRLGSDGGGAGGAVGGAGSGHGGEDPLDELRLRVEQAELPPAAREVADKQLSLLSRIHASSPEHNVIYTYLDWLASLPWAVSTEDQLDLKNARRQLDADHAGLDKVKRRIIEFLAVRALRADSRGSIICLVGPPGVGKTSLGRSVASALQRRFQRLALGGVHDEAEIRGHRRTYIGSMPGSIIQSLRKAGSRNPVILLDEVDKVTSSAHGDPAAALLEVLDPEQNCSFTDHYINTPFDLSHVLFIATANDARAIPPALLDRMEVIHLPGYTVEEKVGIAASYLLPKQVEAHGLAEEHVTVSNDALHQLAVAYTREAGVRNLERQLASICRHVAVQLAEAKQSGKEDEFKTVHVAAKELEAVLGPRKFESEVAARTAVPGVATGLAWTPSGGALLFIEATRMGGKGTLVTTGRLGDVMRESTSAALSWVRSHACELELVASEDDDLLRSKDVHVHFPEGAIPKDGPSAGVAVTLALVSLFTAVRVRADTAMTGEVTLRGAVLPVGGIKEKLLAAHRAGIKRVIIPARNASDLVDVPAAAKEALTVILVDRVEQALLAGLAEKLPALASLDVSAVEAVEPRSRL